MYNIISQNTLTEILFTAAPISHRMHVQSVHAQVKGRQVHALKHLLQGLTAAALNVDDLLGVLLHGPLDESQQVLLIHAGRCMYVCVHLESGQRRIM